MGSTQVTILKDNLIIFQFKKGEAQDWVISNGPWHIGHTYSIKEVGQKYCF